MGDTDEKTSRLDNTVCWPKIWNVADRFSWLPWVSSDAHNYLMLHLVQYVSSMNILNGHGARFED